NPIEQEGTYPLPEAQLDRFLLKVSVAYPAAEDEVTLVEKVTGGRKGDRLDVAAVEQVTTPEAIVALQQTIAGLVVDRRIVEYAVEVVRAARDWKTLRVGPGPRGAIALIRAGRARAVLEGRDYVLPEDIKAVGVPCLAHRVILTPEMEIEAYGAAQVIGDILDSVAAPRS
ncbi:MAG: MoxR family ATPase, partial [Acidobacteria bacterium]|nr:MoxR family ATPase [Acidobacteriota bacterium]